MVPVQMDYVKAAETRAGIDLDALENAFPLSALPCIAAEKSGTSTGRRRDGRPIFRLGAPVRAPLSPHIAVSAG